MNRIIPVALSVGEIARRIGCPIHRVEYVIRSRALQPKERAGNVRVFSEADISLITGEIRRIDARNSARVGAVQEEVAGE